MSLGKKNKTLLTNPPLIALVKIAVITLTGKLQPRRRCGFVHPPRFHWVFLFVCFCFLVFGFFLIFNLFANILLRMASRSNATTGQKKRRQESPSSAADLPPPHLPEAIGRNQSLFRSSLSL